MRATTRAVLLITLAFVAVTLNGLDARSISASGPGFFTRVESYPESPAPVSFQQQRPQRYLNDQDPDHEQPFAFPTEDDTEDANEIRPETENERSNTADSNTGIAIEDTEAGVDVDLETDPEIDAKFLSNIDVNKLTPEQRSVYDELIELAKEEDEAGNSQVQGRTFGLFKLKFHHLWRKFKSLFSGPKFLEFYSEPGVVPVVAPHQPYGQPHYFHDDDDFKKRNELSSSSAEAVAVAGDYPNSPAVVKYRVENPLLRLPIIGDLTKFITRTIPKFYYDAFIPQQQVVHAGRRNFYNNQYYNYALDQY